MSCSHKMGIDLVKLYFYLTGNEPDMNWIAINCDSEQDVNFHSFDEIPLEYDDNISYDLNELFNETAIGPTDYADAQENKRQLLLARLTIIQQAVCINTIDDYGEKISLGKEVTRFFRLNSLISFIISELLRLSHERTIEVANMIDMVDGTDASMLFYLDENDISPLLKLIAISSCDFCEQCDSLMFNEDNKFSVAKLDKIFEKASIVYKKRRGTTNESKNTQSDIFLPFKRLTFQYFKKKAEQS